MLGTPGMCYTHDNRRHLHIKWTLLISASGAKPYKGTRTYKIIVCDK